ncbi:hypothetical protein Tco_1137162, partial [Tanacetum coccineum]
IKTHLGISQEVGTPRYLSLVVPLTKVGDEAVHKELGDRMERAATTASSLEAEQDSGSGPRCQDTILGDVNAQTRFEITSIQSIDPPLSRGYTLGSGEDSMKLIGIDEILLKLVLPVFVSAVKRMLMLPVQVSAVEVNGVRQLQALVDKKRVIVTESIIRKDLRLNDAEGTDCLPTATIFEELAREDLDHPTDSTPIPIIDQPSSSSQPKKKQPSKKAPRQEAEIPQVKAKHEESVPTPSNDPQPSVDETQERQDDDLIFDTRVLEDDEMHVEAKVDRKEEQSTKSDDSTAGEAVTTTSIDDSIIPTTIKEITLAQTLIQIKAVKPKVVTTAATTITTTRPKDKGVVVQEPS